MQLNLDFFDPPDPPGGPLGESPAAGHWEQLDEPARWLIELATGRGLRDHVNVMMAGQTERFPAL